MKIAVLGGSFNPVHIGHLSLADAVCNEFGYDKVLFIPTATPPHKKMAHDFASAEDRFSMLKAALADDSRFVADRCELDRGGISYTYDTLLELENRYKDELTGKIGFIMGSDLIAGFHLWHKAEKIAEIADLILASRKTSSINNAFSQAREKNTPIGDYGKYENLSDEEREECRQTFSYPHILLKTPLLPVSSTDIRIGVRNKGCFRYLVPNGVYWYIIKNKLYSVENENGL